MADLVDRYLLRYALLRDARSKGDEFAEDEAYEAMDDLWREMSATQRRRAEMLARLMRDSHQTQPKRLVFSAVSAGAYTQVVGVCFSTSSINAAGGAPLPIDTRARLSLDHLINCPRSHAVAAIA